MGKASSPSSGFNASTFMYGFIFMMYAVVACVLFWLMANRRERRKNRQEQARQQEEFDQEVEAVDAGVESLAEESKTEKSEGDSEDCDNGDGDVKETTFESPSPEEIEQLTAEPKKLIEKKLE